MNDRYQNRIVFASRSGSWLALLLLIPLAALIVVLGIFFFALVLALGAIVFAAFFARVWWLKRKMRRNAGKMPLEGEYQVVEAQRARTRDADE